ncbi:MAG: ATP-binding cassette domain-containing protein, partial [Gammaproteobacteria bacterium]|nr:ATP-binding cassette domain-containing protein [Gammaproteobacteria bacterium]
MSKPVVLSSKGLTKVYTEGAGSLRIFDGIDLSVHAGETLASVGSSGAGKTTLLNILGGLDTPTAGEVHVSGQNL